MHPPLGLFHASEQNAFNLADDLIEPFRALVDLHVAKNPATTEGNLASMDKAALVALLNVDVGMPQGTMSVLSAIEYAVESLGRLFEHGDSKLELPTVIGLQAHKLEC
jgi:CRISPR-associated protein Cas1